MPSLWATFTVGATPVSNIAKISIDTGSLDKNFAASLSGSYVHPEVVLASSSGVFVGGYFDYVNGLPRSNLVKLNAVVGSLDPQWAATFSGVVTRLAIEGDSLYAVGCFNQVSGVARNYVARLQASGTGALDNTWAPAPNGGCLYGLRVTANHVYLGGYFTSISGAPVARAGRVAKTGTGVADAAWAPQIRSIYEWVFDFGALPNGTVCLPDLLSASMVATVRVSRGLARQAACSVRRCTWNDLATCHPPSMHRTEGYWLEGDSSEWVAICVRASSGYCHLAVSTPTGRCHWSAKRSAPWPAIPRITT